MKRLPVLLAILGLFGSALCPGQETPAPSASQSPKGLSYHSSTSLSLVLTSGNSRTLTFSFDTDQKITLSRHALNVKGSMIYSRVNGQKRSEIYYTHLNYNFQLNDSAYLLGLVRYESNAPSGYPSRFALSAGGGCTWVQTKVVTFFSDLAVGWSSENSTTKVNLNNISGTPLDRTLTSSFLSTIFTSKITIQISSSSQLTHQDVLFLNMKEVENYRLNSTSSVSAAINRNLGLKMSFQINYEMKPVAGYKPTDVYFLSSLVISI